MRVLLLAAVSISLFAQTNQPVPLRVYTQDGIAVDTIIDNRSTVNRSLRFVTIACSGSGTWSAALLYGSTTASFTSYGSAATVANTDSTPTAYGFLFTSPNYIKVDLTGTVTCNLSGFRDLYSTGSSGSVTYPVPVASGGTGATTAAGARTNLGVPWTISGSNLYFNTGNVSIGNTTSGSPLTISGQSTLAAPPTGTALHVSGVNGAASLVTQDAYVGVPSYIGRMANGTAASPTATLDTNHLALFGGRGYGATGWSSTSRASIAALAGENWTDSAQGAYLSFRTTQIGSAAQAERWFINPYGHFLAGTDNSYDIGNDATFRPRDVNIARNLKVAGTVTFATPLPIGGGGTGASTASTARTALGIIDSLTSRQTASGTKDSANDIFTVTIGGSWTVSFVDVYLNGVVLPTTGYAYSAGTITMTASYIPSSTDSVTALIYYSAGY